MWKMFSLIYFFRVVGLQAIINDSKVHKMPRKFSLWHNFITADKKRPCIVQRYVSLASYINANILATTKCHEIHSSASPNTYI